MCLQIGRTYSEFSLINQKEYQTFKKEIQVKNDSKGIGMPGYKNNKLLFRKFY